MNGRVLVQPPNHMALFDRPVQATSTYTEAMTGNWTNTPLSLAFFSPANQQILQNGIRAGVYNMSACKYVISQQPTNDLKIIMRSIFLQHSLNQPGNVRRQIQKLNQRVLDYLVPQVYREAKGYLTYLRDISTLAVPLATPVNTVAYDKTLELKPFF